MSNLSWPAWFDSKDGSKSRIFNSAEEVPSGWTSGAEKISVKETAKETPKEVSKTDKVKKADLDL